MERILTQGGIYICDLNPVIGSEQGGTRPCVVISNSLGCIYAPIVTVVPITSKKKKFMPTHLELPQEKYPCFKMEENIVLGEQARVLDKSRIKDFIGKINKSDLMKIIEKVNENFIIND